MQTITEQQVKDGLIKIADSLASFTFDYPVPLKLLAHTMGVDLRPAQLSVIGKIVRRKVIGREIKDRSGRVFAIGEGNSLDGCRLLLTHVKAPENLAQALGEARGADANSTGNLLLMLAVFFIYAGVFITTTLLLEIKARSLDNESFTLAEIGRGWPYGACAGAILVGLYYRVKRMMQERGMW